MPAAPRSVVHALRVGVGENRTTALLAVASQLHAPFAASLIARVLPRDVARVELDEVSVEVPAAGRRVDLELIARTSEGPLRLWFEAKWDAAWQPRQLAAYNKTLKSMLGGGRLLALVPEDRADRVERDECDDVITWSEVAALADRAGSCEHRRGGGQGAWRAAARTPDAFASQYVPDMVLLHLKEENGVTIDPLTISHAIALRHANEALTTSARLAEDAIKGCGYRPVSDEHWSRKFGHRWTLASDAPGAPRWWDGAGKLVLWRSVSGTHVAGGAAFLAGVRLPTEAYEDLQDYILSLREADGSTPWPWPLSEVREPGFGSVSCARHCRLRHSRRRATPSISNSRSCGAGSHTHSTRRRHRAARRSPERHAAFDLNGQSAPWPSPSTARSTERHHRRFSDPLKRHGATAITRTRIRDGGVVRIGWRVAE